MLKPQDIVVLTYLYTLELEDRRRSSHLASMAHEWTFQGLSNALGLSKSSLHRSIQHALDGELIRSKHLNSRRFIDFLIFGVPVIFPAQVGQRETGTPTTLSAPIFPSEYELVANTHHVWSNPRGQISGASIPPLHESAIELAESNQDAHRILAAVDSLRVGKARERALAAEYLSSFEEVV